MGLEVGKTHAREELQRQFKKFYDGSLKSPAHLRPALTDFRHSGGSGPSVFLPCWYRFRYVDVKTGGYSDFSA